MQTKQLEILKSDTPKNYGGKRSGAGRKKHLPTRVDIEKGLELLDIQAGIKMMARKILSSQAVAALGMWQIAILHRDSSGKISYSRVRDDKEIIRLLEEGEHGKDYFVFAGEAPDWKAGADMLNRAGLKPKDNAENRPTVNIFNLLKQDNGNSG